MPSIAYGTGIYRRDNGNFPELKLINMYVEAAKTSEQGAALLSRPGLGLLASPSAAGPINGMFCKAGNFDGDVFSISNTSLFRGTTNLGGVGAYTNAASFAAGFGEMLLTRGGTMYFYDGSTLDVVAFPDSEDVRAVCFIGSLFVAVRGDTSGKFYWSAPLDGELWDALDFATAERESDALLDILPLGDNIWLYGERTIECWAHTGAADLPFTRQEQVAFDQGLMDTGCVVAADNTHFFIGSKRMVFRLGEVPERISDHGLEERLAAATSARMFTFWHEGHEFVCIRTDTETLVYDCSSRQWCEFQSSGGNWIAAYAAMSGDTVYFGHASASQLMGWDEWDDMGATLTRQLSFAQQLDEPMSIDVIRLWVNSGANTDGIDAAIELRLSDDAGRTFGDWEADRLGDEAEYRCIPEWRAMGTFDFPGILGEIRVTDAVPFRLSAIKINDQSGDRSRV